MWDAQNDPGVLGSFLIVQKMGTYGCNCVGICSVVLLLYPKCHRSRRPPKTVAPLKDPLTLKSSCTGWEWHMLCQCCKTQEKTTRMGLIPYSYRGTLHNLLNGLIETQDRPKSKSTPNKEQRLPWKELFDNCRTVQGVVLFHGGIHLDKTQCST